jgi:tRNA threonylcarbamoyladenosine biosynthesis protein TsaB
MPDKDRKISLVIDASHPACFAGMLDGSDRWLAKRAAEGPALESLFPVIEGILSESSCAIEQVKRFIFCEGPGSTLGLRLAAMALKTWRALQPTPPSLLGYNSLEFAAACLLQDQADLKNALLVADWKKDAWNALKIENGKTAAIQVITQSELDGAKAPVFHLPQRKGWQAPPANATTLTYEPKRLCEVLNHPGLLHVIEEPIPHASAPPNFQKWTPDRHRAPISNA